MCTQSTALMGHGLSPHSAVGITKGKIHTPLPHLSLLLQSAVPWRNLLVIKGCANLLQQWKQHLWLQAGATYQGQPLLRNCGRVATACQGPSGLRLSFWTLLSKHWNPEWADPSMDGQNQPVLHNTSLCRNFFPKFTVWSVLQSQLPLPPAVYQEGREQLVTKMIHRQPNYPNCGIWNRCGNSFTAQLLCSETKLIAISC